MEEQDYSALLEEAQNEDTLFSDPTFPPTKKSLCPPSEWNEKYDEVEWVRACKIPSLTDDEGDLAIFADGITPNDINQGGLGDCYFLSTLSVIAEFPERIKKLFLDTSINENSIFAVRLTKNGERIQVVLDDYIPTKDHEPCYANAKGNELWVLLLEKAWAKIHGSYDRIVSGQAHLVMRDLTSAPAYEYVIEKTDDMFEKILEADQRNWILASGTGDQAGADELE
mmetsp:Transcript_15663/g.24004  ORF Transcript_15663/g.24004 Transcript_15663/m.24004 type:complete len:226 (+) Transcript_15663:21-698(+)